MPADDGEGTHPAGCIPVVWRSIPHAQRRFHLPAVREELEPLMMRALVSICGVTELEMLYSARNIQERARKRPTLLCSCVDDSRRAML